MKCDLCGGENIGPDLVCETCGTRLSRAPGGSEAIEPYLSRQACASPRPDHADPSDAMRAARLAELLGRPQPASPLAPGTTAFRMPSGLALQVNVPPVPPPTTDSAATPVGPGSDAFVPSVAAAPPGAERAHDGQAFAAPDHVMRPHGDTLGNASQRRTTRAPPGLLPPPEAYAPHWSTPQQEYAARETSNLHRAVVGLLVAVAITFGLTMDWSGADNRPTLHPGKTPPVAASRDRPETTAQSDIPAPPQDHAAQNGATADEAIGKVASADEPPARDTSAPSRTVEATEAASSARIAPRVAAGPEHAQPGARAVYAPVAQPRTAVAATSEKAEKAEKSGKPEKTAKTEKTEGPVRRGLQEHPRTRLAKSSAKRRRELVASAKVHRKDEIDRLRVEAFSETSADRTAAAPAPSDSLVEAARRAREHTRHVARSAYQQCERLDSFLDRERCKWHVCDGKWGQGDCPAYKRASLY